jgi:hypothetical protein
MQEQMITNTMSDERKAYLLETSKWGKFLAIIGFIGAIFIIGLGIIFLFAAGALGMDNLSRIGFPTSILSIVYILIGLVYFFPAKYLYDFSNQMRAGLITGDEDKITTAFGKLKSMFKFFGISTIVVLGIYVLIFIIAIGVAMIGAGSKF